MLNTYCFVGGRRRQLGAVNMSIPRRRGKEAPPRQTGSEESEENVTDESEETSRSHNSDQPYVPDEIGHSASGRSNILATFSSSKEAGAGT